MAPKTQKIESPTMKFTQRELQVVAGAPPVRQVEDGATFLPVTGALSKCPRQFFEAGERLPYGFEKGGHQLAITRKGGETMFRRLPPVERIDRLEESIYWLLSAVTLTYLLLELIGH
jgi:hypothetical protein